MISVSDRDHLFEPVSFSRSLTISKAPTLHPSGL